MQNIGRAHGQERLRELLNDDKLSSSLKGWIRQEINAIASGKRSIIRRPPGYELAHKRGFEASKDFGFLFADLQLSSLHRTQHKFDKQGKLNKTPLWMEEIIRDNSIAKNTKEGQRQMRQNYDQWKNCSSGQPGNLLRAAQARQSQQFKSSHGLNYSTYPSYVKPGGIELCSPLKLVSDDRRNADIIITSICVDPTSRSVVVKAANDPYDKIFDRLHYSR